jgi:isopropylmalate/homocitrate/citramalate synthase/prephenate dehydratase
MTRHRNNTAETDPSMVAIVAAGTPVVCIFGKSWLLHVREVLQATPEQNLEMIADSVAYPTAAGRETIYDAEHYFDGYKDDPAYALATLRAARGAGARTLVLCETNGGAMPDEVTAIVRASMDRARPATAAPEVIWGIHCHNDGELAVANSLAAVAAGARHVQGTINGYGERCGNANLVSILADLELKTAVRAGSVRPAGRADGDVPLHRRDRQHRPGRPPAVCRPVRVRPQGRRPRRGDGPGQPLLPARGPGAVGNVMRLVVSELGGKANTQLRAEQLGQQMDGVDPKALSQIIKQLEAEGLAFEGAEASFELLVMRHKAGYEAPFTLCDYTTLVEQRNGAELMAVATVKVEVAGEDPAYRRRRQRPGQRPGLRAAQGARGVLSGAGRGPPGGLQGPHPGQRRGHRRSDARDHRVVERLAGVVHDGRRHEHHRRVVPGAVRLAGIRDLEDGRGSGPARRAPLHDRRASGGLPSRRSPNSIASRRAQWQLRTAEARSPRVAFQGEPGAFSEEGVLSAFASPEAVALPTWRAVFEAVHDGSVDAGVVPIERSKGGSVREIYDLLFQFDEIRIAAEVTVPVHLALLALPGQTLDQIERVYSIAQALDQADEFLRSRPWQVMTSYNTAGAAKAIVDKAEMGAGAIASPRVAPLYGLEVLAEDIQTGAANRTRFAVIARDPSGRVVRARDPLRPDEDHSGLGRPQRPRQPVPLPGLLRRAADQPLAPGVAPQPRRPLGVRLLGRHGRGPRRTRLRRGVWRRCSARR